MFRFSAATQLTKPCATTSIWQLPPVFASCAQHLSYHMSASRWHIQPDGTVILHTVGRGQEFVTEADPGLVDWACQIIEANHAGERKAPGSKAFTNVSDIRTTA